MAEYYTTQAGAGLKNGNDWANAFDEPALEVHLEGAGVAGDHHWIMDGTYTLDSDINSSARAGSAVSPISIIGVKAGTTNEPPVYSDWSRADADRPFFDCAVFEFRVGARYIIRNISLQGSDTNVLYVGNRSIVENCKIENDNGIAAAKRCLNMSIYSIAYNNEIFSTNTNGIYTTGFARIKFNYIHDMSQAAQGIGLNVVGDGVVAEFNIFDNCTTGVNSGNGHDDSTIDNNTFYGCDSAVLGTNGSAWVLVNNLFEGQTVDGFKWTTQTDNNFFWRNHGDDARNNDMWDLVAVTPSPFADHEVTVGNPLFTTPGADHSLQDTSPDIGVGMSITLGVG